MQHRKFILALLIAGCTSLAKAQEDYAWLEDDWRPTEAPVAIINNELVTEEDLFLWQVLQEQRPESVRVQVGEMALLQAQNPQALRKAVESLSETRILAYTPQAEWDLSQEVVEKASRIAAGRVALVVFADLMVRPDVVVTDYDIANYYRQNLERYSEPALIEALALRMPINDPLNPDDRAAGRQRAVDLRRQALTAGGLRALRESHPELPDLEPITVREGEEDIPPEIEAALFRLASSKISSPQLLQEYVVLYEVLSRSPETQVPLEYVAEEITDRLERRIFGQQMQYKLGELVRQTRPINRARHFSVLEDEMMLLQVGDYILTKGEFLKLYPEYQGLIGKTPDSLNAIIDSIIRGEVVTQYLREEGLLAAPRYERALELAREAVYARNAARQLMREANPGEQEIAQYADANRETLAPGYSRYVWKLEARPRQPDELGPMRRSELQDVIMQRMQPLVTEAERLLEERARISGEVAYVSPQFVLSRLIGAQPGEYVITFNRLGEFTPVQADQRLGIDFSTVEVGDFTTLRRMNDGSVVGYYLADQKAIPAPEREELLRRARQALVRQAAYGPAEKELDRIRARGLYEWRVELD